MFLALVILMSVMALVYAVWWMDISRILSAWLYLAIGAFVFLALPRKSLEQFVSVSTYLLLFMVSGAWIAFGWLLLGGGAILQIEPTARPYYVVPFSLVLSDISSIRPSGIFSEPGAFAFFISIIAASRHLLGFDRRATWAILAGGVVTGSLALIIYIVVHFFAEIRGRGAILQKMSLVVVVLSLGALLIALTPQGKAVVDRLVPSESEDRIIEGDNRTVLTLLALQQLQSEDAWLFGVKDIGLAEGAASANPLAPIVQYGLIFGGMYYAAIIIFLFLSVFWRRYTVLLGVALMFVQRPYLFRPAYGAGFFLVLACVLVTRKKWSSAVLPEGMGEPGRSPLFIRR